MNRLRKSFRDSFRRKKDRVPESSKPHQWEDDERAVRVGDCSFPVKYLGCVEVFDSRGMQVCEEALKVLRLSRRRPVKGVLYVTGDGLRVVDDDKKGLIVDQTIEKVSFCAPDRYHEKGFSYICRDGATRRWMCHGFHASKDSGERLSHAVGCAFAVCLERKQKRDRDLSVSMQFDNKTSTFTRNGSFRQSTITDRLKDPQVAKPAAPPPVKAVHNPFAIERPHATPQLLERQGSFRGFSGLSQASPFKRQLSLRLSELPSNLQRQRAQSLASNGIQGTLHSSSGSTANTSGIPGYVAPLPTTDETETTPVPGMTKSDTISEMCKELSKGLQILTDTEEPFPLSPSKGSVFSDSSPSSPVKKPDPFSTASPVSPVTTKASLISVPAVTPPAIPVRRNCNISQLRSQSLAGSDAFRVTRLPPPVSSPTKTTPVSESTAKEASTARRHHQFTKAASLDGYSAFKYLPRDPFDTDWAAVVTNSTSTSVSKEIKDDSQPNSNSLCSTNPFTDSSNSIVKTFEIKM